LGLWVPQEGGLSVGQKAQIHVRNAYFGTTKVRDTETKAMIDRVQLVLEVDAQPDIPRWVTELTVGSGWLVVDGGRKLQWGTEGVGTPSFMASSRYGEWLNAVIGCAEDWVRAQLAAGLTPDTAACWIGSDWLLEALDTGRPRNDGKGNVVHMLPVKRLGGAAAPAAAPAAPPPAAGIEASIIALAKTLDHQTWFQTVMADSAMRQWVTDNAKVSDFLRPELYYDRVRGA
jgi:hypothetical protein